MTVAKRFQTIIVRLFLAGLRKLSIDDLFNESPRVVRN